MVDDPFNLTDIRKKPTGKGGVEVVTGFLVVGTPKTEAQMMEYYGGDQRKLPPETIIFEDADGNVETISPRKGTDL